MNKYDLEIMKFADTDVVHYYDREFDKSICGQKIKYWHRISIYPIMPPNKHLEICKKCERILNGK